VLQRVAVCCSVLRCSAVMYSIVEAHVCCETLIALVEESSVLLCVAVCRCVPQCVAVCCCALQCAAVCCSVFVGCCSHVQYC